MIKRYNITDVDVGFFIFLIDWTADHTNKKGNNAKFVSLVLSAKNAYKNPDSMCIIPSIYSDLWQVLLVVIVKRICIIALMQVVIIAQLSIQN